MTERFGELPKNTNEAMPIRMTKAQFDIISDSTLESSEDLDLLKKLGITISDDSETVFKKISVDGDIKYMCVNRNDFGTIKQFSI